MAIIVERTEPDVSFELDVDRGGGVTGLAPTVALRDGDTNASYLDFNDGTFKTVGWTTRKASLTEISASLAPGRYVRRLNLNSITIPVATRFLIAEFETTGAALGIGSDVYELVDSFVSLPTAAAVAAVAADVDDLQTRLPAALVSGRIDASVGAMAADVITASALSTAAGTEIAAAVDTTLTAAHGAGAWGGGGGLTTQDVRDAMKLAPSVGAPAAGSIDLALDEIEADTAAMQPTIATNLDALVSSRATQAQILSDATPFAGANLDAAITSRPTAAQIDATLTAAHGAGAWGGGGLTTQDVRDAMKLAPSVGAPAAGSIDLALDEIEADTDSLDATKITTARANNLDQITAARLAELDAANLPADVGAILVDTAAMQPTIATNLDAAITSRPTAAQIDTTLTAAHGAGSWAAGGGLTTQDVRDAMKLAPSVGAPAAGSIDLALDNVEGDVAGIVGDVATLLARLTALRAAALDEITGARLAELDGANLPADVAATLARVNNELVRIHTYLGLLVGTPAVHTPASVVAGSISQTVGVAGSTVTKAAIT